MERAHIDISTDLDGEAVVHACFDLSEAEISRLRRMPFAPARRIASAPRACLADEVLELRELTVLADDLGESSSGVRAQLVLRPARLSAYRHAITRFVESRDEADWLREEDYEALVHAATACCFRSSSSARRRCAPRFPHDAPC